MTDKRETKNRIQTAINQIRESRLSDEESQQIADRVWERLESRSAQTTEAAEVGAIRGCEDYQALIPTLLTGSLAPSRALLLEEHTRTCVPCRRALKSARNGEQRPRTTDQTARRPRQVLRWAMAAALGVVALGTAFTVWNAGPTLPYGAIVESSGAGLYRTATLERLAPDAQIAVGESVRAAPGESSILRLADGSLVEVKGRSELAVESARRGTTVRVDRGSVIVEAAPQERGRLFVSTEDCLVSVKGTIFAVSHGTRGSRVAVIEGEVKVDYAGAEKTLVAGDRTATYAGGPVNALHDELAWSQGVDRYLELVREVTALRQALERELPRPGLRYSSRLLDLAPADMVFYAAFPNLVETLVEADRIVQERLSQSEALRDWWQDHQGSGMGAHMALTSKLADAGSYLGDEIVVTGSIDAQGEMRGPIILAELTDPGSFRLWLEEMAETEDGELPGIVFVEEAATAGGTGDGDVLFVWLGSDTLVAAPRLELVVETRDRAAQSGQGGLKDRVAEVYREGAETLVAIDAQEIARTMGLEDPEGMEHAEQLGLLDASHVIFQQKRFDDRTENTGVLAFDGPRQGVASWLAEPAPMGSLRYVSPDAKLVASGIVMDPAEIVGQIIAMAESDGSVEDFRELEQTLGLDVREDLAAALGGEFTVALDGPVVPEPAWKVVAEVYDPDKLAWALQQIVEAANDERAEAGRTRLEWLESEADGRVYYGIGGDRAMEFTFDEGYLVAAANRGLIDRAIRYRQSGYSIESSSRFTALLPTDGRQNFSAFIFQDALGLLAPIADRIAATELTEAQRAALETLQSESEPTLAYAYAEESRIVFAASGAMNLLSSGLPGLIGMGGFCLDNLAPPIPPAPTETPDTKNT